MTPLEARPRMASPRLMCSILMTSAPQSARMAEAAGTKVCSATLRIRTPFMMSVIWISLRSKAGWWTGAFLAAAGARVGGEAPPGRSGTSRPATLIRHGH